MTIFNITIEMSKLYIRLFKHLTIKTKHNSKTHKKYITKMNTHNEPKKFLNEKI